MVTFEELRITNDGNDLIIKAKVDENQSGVYIEKVIIDTEKTYVDGKGSDDPIYTYEYSENVQEVDLDIDRFSVQPIRDFKDNLFFVYVKVKGTPNVNTPCGDDNIYTLGVVFHPGRLYSLFMNGLREFGDTCSVPQDFVNNLLQYKALKLALETGDCIRGIEYYNRLFNGSGASTPSNCNCHGRVSV